MDKRAKVKQFILDEIVGESNPSVVDFRDDENLTDSGILDSLGMLKLVSFLDEQLNSDIMSQAFALDEFETLDKIVARIDASAGATAEPGQSTAGSSAETRSSDESSVTNVSTDSVEFEKVSSLDLGLDGKVVLITGSSRGLGAMMAKMFAARGARVVVNYRADRAAADKVVADIKRFDGESMVVAADVSDPGQVIHMQKAVEAEWGGVDILVNNAIQTYDAANFLELEWPDVQSAVDVVVRGAFNCCKAVIPHMLREGGGKIVNIGTLATDNPVANTLKYVMTKSALVGLTRSLAVDYAENQIQVNMVCPSLVETDLVAHIPQGFKQKIANDTPMKRNATATDVAQSVLFLASNMCGFMTGQKLMVTGGQAPFH